MLSDSSLQSQAIEDIPQFGKDLPQD